MIHPLPTEYWELYLGKYRHRGNAIVGRLLRMTENPAGQAMSELPLFASNTLEANDEFVGSQQVFLALAEVEHWKSSSPAVKGAEEH
jgi:hypothetical protein